MWKSMHMLLALLVLIPAVAQAQDDNTTIEPIPIEISEVKLNTTDVDASYVFGGNAGQAIQVRVISISDDYSPVFTIRRDEAAFGVWYTLEGNSAIAQITLPDDGNYEIEVLGNEDEAAEYVLTVQAEGMTMADGSPMEMADIPCQYVVQQGDNMFRIALNLGVELDDMVEANPQIDNYRRIFPGNVLSVPGCEG